MEWVKKLDKITIEDNLNLSSQEILSCAQDIADDRSKLYNWKSIEVRSVTLSIEATPGFRRFEFEVFGVAGENFNEFENLEQTGPVNTPKSAAASSEVDL